MGEEIGFVGLGNMGGPMANRLIDAGHRLAVYDIRDEAMAPLVARGAARMNSSHAVADASDIVFFSLPEPKDVEGEALGPAGVATGQRGQDLRRSFDHRPAHDRTRGRGPDRARYRDRRCAGLWRCRGREEGHARGDGVNREERLAGSSAMTIRTSTD